MTFGSTARILGTFEGKITSKGEVQIAAGANCKATVHAERVMVDGVVEGNVTAHDRIQLNANATLKGDLVATKLIVTEGATFIGHCTVGPDAAKSGAAKSSATVESKAGSAKLEATTVAARK